MTEIIDPPTATEIGEARYVHKLERGYHVRLPDGRWALLLTKPVVGLAVAGSDRLGASVSIEYRHTEGASWARGEKVFSRSPGEQIRHVESVFRRLRKGGAA